MNASKLVVAILFALTVFALPMVSAQADKDAVCPNEGFNCECQNFYNSTDYRAIEKWSYDGNDYKIDETNPAYAYFNIDVTGDLKEADWTSSPDVYSVLVKAGNEQVEFDGGASGTVTSKKDISHITFCKYYDGSNGGCTGGNCGGNGVPEFPGLAVGAAVAVATLGLVFLRKN